MKAFDFGKNWKAYSRRALDEEALSDAVASIRDLLEIVDLDGKTFLDIGFGSGLFAIAAKRLGAAEVVAIDVNPLCIEVARKNTALLMKGEGYPEFIEMSVLDGGGLEGLNKFDIVYAWGSLHHTGDMKTAVRNAAGRVAGNGIFAVAIYNRHFTSPLWRIIKKNYNIVPGIVKVLMIYAFFGVIFIAKLAATGRNPLKKKRGMNFYYDVIDWLGGYPYEYASPEQINDMMSDMGFELKKCVHADVPTGCNEFVFIKKQAR